MEIYARLSALKMFEWERSFAVVATLLFILLIGALVILRPETIRLTLAGIPTIPRTYLLCEQCLLLRRFM